MQPSLPGYVNAVQVYPIAEGALYQLYAAPGEVTDVELEVEEQLVGSGPVAAGDTVRWIIRDGKRRWREQTCPYPVQQLVAQTAVQAFDISVLLRFARRDVMPFDAAIVCPLKNGVRRKLRPGVADGRRWTAVLGDDGVQFTRHAATRD